ncbi:MAG: cell division protein FtsQ/DivIB [Schwartzia sp. (in: firmicutes)]
MKVEENEGIMEGKLPPQAVARHKWRWLLQALFFLGAVAAVAAAVFYLPFFKVQSVSVVGNGYVPTADICRIAGIYRGQHLLQVETDTAARTLTKDLRIEQASVRRVFPNGIMIEVEERRPVAAIACEYGFLDLDRQGMVLNAHKQREQGGIPLLTGVTAQDRYIGDRVEAEAVQGALLYLSGFDTGELAQIVELRLSDPEKVVGCTSNAVEIRLGRLERLDEKIRTTKTFLQDLRTSAQPIAFISMEYAQPFVRFR